ncbi:MAG: hypothetical protein E7575_02575 [Ruminococcaceae bacterium]|nr:hypothetical protein [Oscillospiraceae bacterium]
MDGKKEKKRIDKKTAFLIIISGAALLCVAALLFFFRGPIADLFSSEEKKKASSPADGVQAEESGETEEKEEDVPEYIIKKSTATFCEKTVEKYYESIVSLIRDGGSIKGELSAQLSKAVLKILGYDLCDEFGFDYTFSFSEGKLYLCLSASIGSKAPFVTATAAADLLDGILYAECDELLEGGYRIKIPGASLAELFQKADRSELCALLADNLPSREDLSYFLAKAMTVAAHVLGEDLVLDPDAQLSLGDVLQRGLLKTRLVINKDSILAFRNELLRAMERDERFSEYILSLCKELAEYGEKKPSELEELFLERIWSMSSSPVASLILDALQGTEISVWTDAYYKLCAFEVNGNDGARLYGARAKYGTDAAYELTFSGKDFSYTFSGEGKEKDSLYNGDISFCSEGKKLFTFKLSDFDFDRPVNGKAGFELAKQIGLNLSGKTEGGKAKVSLNFKVYGYKLCSAVLKAENCRAEKVSIPGKGKSFILLFSRISEIGGDDIKKLLSDAGFDVDELSRMIDDISSLMG